MKLIIYLVYLLPFCCFAQEWTTDFETAKSIAQEKNKTIVLVFQGSDWCAPCIKLDKEIFQSEEFMSHASSNYVMLKADFPRRKKNALSKEQQEHNEKLAETYNKNGYFPYIVVIGDKDEVLGEVGYKKTTPQSYIELLESFKNK